MTLCLILVFLIRRERVSQEGLCRDLEKMYTICRLFNFNKLVSDLDIEISTTDS